MPACRSIIQSTCFFCACFAALGCVTEQTREGSFVTGGPGQYGQPAPGVPSVVNAKPGDKTYKPPSKLQLAVANFQETRGWYDEARKSYEQVLAGDAKSVDAVIGLARLDQVAGRAAEAEAGFKKAVQMDGSSGKSLDALGQFYLEQKRLSEAVATLQRALASPADEDTAKLVRFHYGIALARTGQLDQATPHLVQAVGSAAAHYNIGLILHERGELAASEEEFGAAILENPRLKPAQHWFNVVRREREQIQAAGHIEQTAVTDRGPRR
jgi:tetratricopeptide (TPR) repeat protein